MQLYFEIDQHLRNIRNKNPHLTHEQQKYVLEKLWEIQEKLEPEIDAEKIFKEIKEKRGTPW